MNKTVLLFSCKWYLFTATVLKLAFNKLVRNSLTLIVIYKNNLKKTFNDYFEYITLTNSYRKCLCIFFIEEAKKIENQFNMIHKIVFFLF